MGIACLIGASNPIAINAQANASSINAENAQDSTQAMRERLRQDSILWESNWKQLPSRALARNSDRRTAASELASRALR